MIVDLVIGLGLLAGPGRGNHLVIGLGLLTGLAAIGLVYLIRLRRERRRDQTRERQRIPD